KALGHPKQVGVASAVDGDVGRVFQAGAAEVAQIVEHHDWVNDQGPGRVVRAEAEAHLVAMNDVVAGNVPARAVDVLIHIRSAVTNRACAGRDHQVTLVVEGEPVSPGNLHLQAGGVDPRADQKVVFEV